MKTLNILFLWRRKYSMYVGSTSQFSDNPSLTWMTSQVPGSRLTPLHIHEYITNLWGLLHDIIILPSVQLKVMKFWSKEMPLLLAGGALGQVCGPDKRRGIGSSRVYWWLLLLPVTQQGHDHHTGSLGLLPVQQMLMTSPLLDRKHCCTC